MDTISSNSISYKGVVKIDISQKGKHFPLTMFNNGTVYLGLLFSKILAGYFNSSDIPKWFDFEVSEGQGIWRSLVRTSVPLTGATYYPLTGNDGDPLVEDGDPTGMIGKVKFVATLQSSNIKSFSTTNKLLRFSMWDNNAQRQCLATLGDSSTDGEMNSNLQLMYDALKAGQDAIITWTMYIINN